MGCPTIRSHSRHPIRWGYSRSFRLTRLTTLTDSSHQRGVFKLKYPITNFDSCIKRGSPNFPSENLGREAKKFKFDKLVQTWSASRACRGRARVCTKKRGFAQRPKRGVSKKRHAQVDVRNELVGDPGLARHSRVRLCRKPK
jgi:hypothetical protein